MKPFIFLLSIFLSAFCFPQKSNKSITDTVPANSLPNITDMDYVKYTDLGECKITLQTLKRIREVKVYSFTDGLLVYEKDGSLHDLEVSKIKSIRTSYKLNFKDWYCYYIKFDDNQKPYLVMGEID